MFFCFGLVLLFWFGFAFFSETVEKLQHHIRNLPECLKDSLAATEPVKERVLLSLPGHCSSTVHAVQLLEGFLACWRPFPSSSTKLWSCLGRGHEVRTILKQLSVILF